MNAQDLKHYLADAPPSVVRLEIETHFDPLSDKQKRYAHFISRLVGPAFRGHVTSSLANPRFRASFAATRVVLRQISPESEPIVSRHPTR